ncbi:hypothetical protein ACQPZF_35600 [Actinosynnema sp. CS-041913]|uniref:hypothetical protein n=1 Tax=Actinosynnema sp. CS-041913 TaxID=3239917 RepID=UPI003D94F6B3
MHNALDLADKIASVLTAVLAVPAAIVTFTRRRRRGLPPPKPEEPTDDNAPKPAE